MKRMIALLLALCVSVSLLPTAAYAYGSYGVDFSAQAYQSAINPYFASGYGGSPVNGSNGECTWYVWGRVCEKLGIQLPFHGHATDWTSLAAEAGYSIGTAARANAIMVEHYSPYGHVFFVERVENGFAYVSEANYLGTYHEDCINLSTMKRSNMSTAMNRVDYIYLDGESGEAGAGFTPWEDERYTYVGETDAAIGQQVQARGGKWTEVGMVLYDADGNSLAQAHDTPSAESRYYYRIHDELGVTLRPGTTYQYRFYAVVSGKTFWSAMQSFTTAGPRAEFTPWWSDSYTYIGETDAAIGQDVQVSGGDWTQVGMILYDEKGNVLGRAADRPTSGITKYYYRIGDELGVTLEAGRTYQYRFFAVVSGTELYSRMQSFSTSVPDAAFYPWENSRYTYIGTTDACIGQEVRVKDGIWTEVGMVLYSEQGNRLGQASDTPSGTSSHYFYKINEDLGVTLSPDTRYVYRFYAIVSGRTFWGELASFTTVSESNPGVSFGIDVSVHQGRIDWDTASEYIDFAILRCGFGADYPENDDSQWLYNVSECERLGIPYGVYLYSYAENDAEAISEAEHILRLLKGHTPKLPVYYDLEDENTTRYLSDGQILRQTQLVASRVIGAGYRFGVYANLYWWTNRLYSPEYDAYEKWMAAYGDAYGSASKGYGIWQYSCTGSVPGVTGNVDVNFCWMDIDSSKPQHPFIDVSNGDWFRDDVAYVYQNGLMQGVADGEFRPNQTTTRGMIVTILYRLEGSPRITEGCPFADVRKGSYCEKAATWAAQNGIVKGYSAAAFGPNDAITREQMAAILYRFADWRGYDVSGRAELGKYADAGRISKFARESLAWANAMGFITGNTATTLNPSGSASRAQAAAILHRFCEKYLETDDE